MLKDLSKHLLVFLLFNTFQRLIMKIKFLVISAFIGITFSFKVQAQCYLDRHNTTWHDAWTSCEKKKSPNAKRDSSHWIMYQLGYEYTLGKSYFWNHNTPTSLAYGAKKIAIDYSMDGVNWTAWGDFTLQKASGSKYYEGEKGPDLKNIRAQYILLTILENYGGSCASLAELKIDVLSSSQMTAYRTQQSTSDCLSALAYPNPFKSTVGLDITNTCNESYSYYIEDIMGRKISPSTNVNQKGLYNAYYNGSQLGNGVYFLVVNSGTAQVRRKIMKVE